MSSDKARLRVVFLWHQHQPYYKDFETGRLVLPWVRLHGVKDYLDMVKILDEFPEVKQTFNLVPSLIEQIDYYLHHDGVDDHMALTLKPAQNLTESNKQEMLSSFFSANSATMINPFPKYYQLHEKLLMAHSDVSRAVREFTEQDWIDLAVWSNLVWIDPMFRNDPEISYLFEKRHGFTEQDKINLIDFQKKILAQIVPAHKAAQERGQAEISFSPYFHPILPLLIDTDLAREALPHIQLPNERFSHPEDARKQIEMSCEMYRELFGRELRGMWPSEGSVAEPLIPILADFGIKWIATDEEIWAECDVNRSGSLAFHKPYVLRRNKNEVGIIFRDHTLSDKIGFVYSGWDADEAADDFIRSLHGIRDSLKPDELEHAVVAIILDGENAWEYYSNDGTDFLRELYSRIVHDDTIETVTVSDAFTNTNALENIPRLFAGSWINHNFRVWIGHEEDNKAWDLLSAARNVLVDYERNNPDADPEVIRQAWKEIYIAEGSDWCWWYGDEHSSAQDDVFDRLFRLHLTAVYRMIGKTPPDDLLKPIRGMRGISGIEQPIGLVSPVIDGMITSYYEWYNAGIFDCLKAGSAMHRAVNILREFQFGFDDDNIYLKLDLFTNAEDESAAEFDFRCILQTVKDYAFEVCGSEVRMFIKEDDGDNEYRPVKFTGQIGVKKIIELAIPRADIEFDDEFRARLAVEVNRKGEQVERWPSYDWVRTTMPTEDKSTFWNV